MGDKGRESCGIDDMSSDGGAMEKVVVRHGGERRGTNGNDGGGGEGGVVKCRTARRRGTEKTALRSGNVA